MAIKGRPTMLNGINPLSYVGVNPYTPPGMYNLPRDPTVRDNAGFQIGDYWLNQITNDLWYLAQKSNPPQYQDALWIQLGKGPSIRTLTGDVGGPVGPDVNGNIDTLGTAGEILVTGTPGTNTLTWSLDGSIATSYPTDAGTAIPAAGVLNILGAGGITTSGAGNTVTITGTGLGPSDAFSANVPADIDNVTGDSTVYTIVFSDVTYDDNINYDNTTGYYTAPTTGLYEFQSTVTVKNISVLMGEFNYYFIIAGTGPCVGQWAFARGNPYVMQDIVGSGLMRLNGSVTVRLDAGDTVAVEAVVYGGAAATAGISRGAAANPGRTWFSGCRLGD